MKTPKSIWFFFGILTIGIIVMLSSRMQAESPSSVSNNEEKLQVVASFYPLAYLAQHIGGDLVQVTTITPVGVEPHDFEPTPRDMQQIANAAVIVINGDGLEPWAQNINRNIDPVKTHIVVAGESLSDMTFQEEGNTVTDPHVWLDPELAGRMSEVIAAAFIKKDPSHTAQYEQQLALLKAQLVALDNSYKTGLQQCMRRDFVTSHAAFGYLARAYNLNQRAITGLSPETEPSAQQLAATAHFVQEQGIKVIFFESLVSPKLSDTLAQEVGAQTMVLDPIEGLTAEESRAGATYITKMQNNLNNLRIALECK